ncbi:MAG TPA: hypothetical protein VKD23_04465 [Terriglobales bacterium]|nr:hypothetical protein [Terriglobales bacterium]
MDLGFEVIFFAVFAGVIGFFVYRMFRHGGFKAAMFGARIERTVGEVRVEFVAKSFASYQAQQLTSLLNTAVRAP